MKGKSPDPGRSVKTINSDKQRQYAKLEHCGRELDKRWFRKKPYDTNWSIKEEK